MRQRIQIDRRVRFGRGVRPHVGLNHRRDPSGAAPPWHRRRISEENSPKLRCWLCSLIKPNVAASQKQVVPPLPSTTS